MRCSRGSFRRLQCSRCSSRCRDTLRRRSPLRLLGLGYWGEGAPKSNLLKLVELGQILAGIWRKFGSRQGGTSNNRTSPAPNRTATGTWDTFLRDLPPLMPSPRHLGEIIVSPHHTFGKPTYACTHSHSHYRRSTCAGYVLEAFRFNEHLKV